MFDQSYNDGTPGGGFMPQTNTPGGSGGTDKRRQRAHNIVPVYISDILDCGEENLFVEGQEVGMVVLVGQVRSIEHAASKSIFNIQDKSGSNMECVLWVDEGQDHGTSDISENMYCKIVGYVRTNQGKKSVMVLRISPITNMDEVDAHQVEVLYARLKIKQLKNKENASIYGNQDAGLSNSMMSGLGGASNHATGISFGNPKHDMTYKMICGCERDEGISKDELIQQLKGKISNNDLESALDYLSGEGHIYSTIDENHFKAIDV